MPFHVRHKGKYKLMKISLSPIYILIHFLDCPNPSEKIYMESITHYIT